MKVMVYQHPRDDCHFYGIETDLIRGDGQHCYFYHHLIEIPDEVAERLLAVQKAYDDVQDELAQLEGVEPMPHPRGIEYERENLCPSCREAYDAEQKNLAETE